MLTADADGDPMTGAKDYLLHFDPDQLPPAAAFWSLTTYDAEGTRLPTTSTASPSVIVTP